jgi:hypothetical protein
MDREKNSFANENAFDEMMEIFDSWKDDHRKIKMFFLKIIEMLLKRENTSLDFKSRPGVSYSLRANFKNIDGKKRPLFALVDIIDDDPENRWLSICFYMETITDPDNVGNLIPQGILGEDGYCFDLYEFDESMMSYVEERMDEAHAYGIT